MPEGPTGANPTRSATEVAEGSPSDMGTQGPHESPCRVLHFGIKIATGQQKAPGVHKPLPNVHQAIGKAAPPAEHGHPPQPGRDVGSMTPFSPRLPTTTSGFHSYFTNQKQKVNGASLTTYFPGALGDRLSARQLTHTLFIQSFKYPIVSVFSTLIFSILMIWSPALALLGLVTAWGFFSFFSPPPPFFLRSCRAKGEGG